MNDLFHAQDGLAEKVTDKKPVFQGLVVDVEHWDVTLPDGLTATREVLKHPGAAACIPVDDKGRARLVRQYRTPFEQVTLEIPAGKLEPGEEPAACAMRELEEEAGVTCEQLTHLVSLRPAAAYCDEVIHIYLATKLRPGRVHLDQDEFVDAEWIPLQDLVAMAVRGEITDAKTLTAILMARLILGMPETPGYYRG